MSILMQIERFISVHHMSPTRFGRLAVNDPRLIGDMKRGRQPGPVTVERIERFMAAQHTC